DSGQAEVRPAQSERDRADDQRREHRQSHTRQDSGPGRNRAAEQGKPVRADAEIGGMSQRQLSGVAADQVPGEPERGKEKQAEDDVQEVVVVQEQRDDERHREYGGADEDLGALHARWLPKIPLGLNDRTRIKMMKSTTSAHSLPQ